MYWMNTESNQFVKSYEFYHANTETSKEVEVHLS